MSSTFTPGTTSSGQQVLILKEGSTQTKGRDARNNNIFAAKLIAEIVKSSLGPRGMDKMLGKYATKLPGREQLAVLKYADALESIPLTPAENAGMETIDVQVEFRAKHAQGKTWSGVDACTGKVGDMMDEVIEPLAVKEEIIRAATEASCMILRVGDVLASGKSKAPAGPPPGCMGGYSGMGD